MPIHDWTRVAAGIFHHFHFNWIAEISRRLNGGILPEGYYAMAEQVVGPLGPDTLVLHRIVIHHVRDHRIIALIEVVSPANKLSRSAFHQFVRKVAAALARGYQFLVLDLFPPTPREPEGIHNAIWEMVANENSDLPPDKPLTLVSYTGSTMKSAYVEPVAVGDALISMPLFLSEDRYVPVPLEETYRAAWETMPSFWRKVLEIPPL